jgi:hypothetical protein
MSYRSGLHRRPGYPACLQAGAAAPGRPCARRRFTCQRQAAS